MQRRLLRKVMNAESATPGIPEWWERSAGRPEAPATPASAPATPASAPATPASAPATPASAPAAPAWPYAGPAAAPATPASAPAAPASATQGWWERFVVPPQTPAAAAPVSALPVSAAPVSAVPAGTLDIRALLHPTEHSRLTNPRLRADVMGGPVQREAVSDSRGISPGLLRPRHGVEGTGELRRCGCHAQEAMAVIGPGVKLDGRTHGSAAALASDAIACRCQ